MRLSGLVINAPGSRGDDAKNFAFIAGRHEKGAIGRAGQRPDVAGLRREIFARFSALDAIHFSVRRGSRIDDALGIDGYGEDFRLIGTPHERTVAGRVQAIQPSAISRSNIEGAVGSRREAPNLGL